MYGCFWFERASVQVRRSTSLARDSHLVSKATSRTRPAWRRARPPPPWNRVSTSPRSSATSHRTCCARSCIDNAAAPATARNFWAVSEGDAPHGRLPKGLKSTSPPRVAPPRSNTGRSSTRCASSTGSSGTPTDPATGRGPGTTTSRQPPTSRTSSPTTPSRRPTPSPPYTEFLPSFLDPPQHRVEHRRLLNWWFAPAAVQKIAPEIIRHARETIEPPVAAGHTDLFHVRRPVPGEGLPAVDRPGH